MVLNLVLKFSPFPHRIPKEGSLTLGLPSSWGRGPLLISKILIIRKIPRPNLINIRKNVENGKKKKTEEKREEKKI